MKDKTFLHTRDYGMFIILIIILLVLVGCYHKVEVIKYKRVIYEYSVHDTVYYKLEMDTLKRKAYDN